ncbi:unnamed protein product [Clonostachys byssicola]|uniref:O-methylsterigmatocystin oxidoreductase n=1 Tax=Clonostachys byssicola TaxID=160290 RepID=A0A9N9UVN2_9HYPO|nr:unnamed protein product [Clonostachys byssicola]
MDIIPYLAAIGALVLPLAIHRWYRKLSSPRLPPGPRAIPFLGSVFDLPKGDIPDFEHWLQYREKYGPIFSLNVMGQTIVVIHDKQVALDLLEKKSLINSSRPWMEFAGGLVGFVNFTSAVPYNETLRLHRKFMHQQMGTKKIAASFRKDQENEVSWMLENIMDQPERLIDHLHRAAGSFIIKLTYGYSIDVSRPDPVQRLVMRMVSIFNASAQPGVWAVDMFPALHYLPDWFPGTSFKKVAGAWREEVMASAEKPYQFVKMQMQTKSHQPSYVSKALEQCGEDPTATYEAAVKFSAGAMYGGGSDTTVSSLSFLFLAMVKFPDILHKVQEEIDRVVGRDRLPQFEDRPNLPYVEAVVKEAFRWHPVAGMGVPHASDEDQIYNGYLIPKGAILLASIHGMAHDPETYHDPDRFLPERYDKPYNEPDPKEVVFGFGRRICPGRYFADSMVYLAAAQTLAAFDIVKATDEQGQEIDPTVKVLPGVISHPLDFPFRITPRSEKSKSFISANVAPRQGAMSDAKLFEQNGFMK